MKPDGLQAKLLGLASDACEMEARVQVLDGELKETRAELRASRRGATIAERLKSEFLLNMTHQLRTPMTAIVGFSHLLKEEECFGDDGPASGYVDAIRRNAEQLNGLLADIFDLSLLDAGELSVEAQTLSPYKLVRKVVEELRRCAEERGIGLETAVLGSIPVRIRSDSERLEQILANLVRNAIEGTSEGGVRVMLRMDTVRQRSCLRIEVVDTGRGMSPDELGSVFEAFAQGQEGMVRRAGAAGIGLTIAYQMARVLGGELSAESIEGHGSVFRLEIDAGDLTGTSFREYRADDNPDDQDDATTRTLRTFSRTAGRPRHVLYVEDGPDNRRLVTTLLQKSGFEVACAENGQNGVEAALASLTETPFDVILMDLQMPVLDGYEATRQLRHAGWRGPIIALTAHALQRERERALSVGCDQFLTKPIDRKELTSAIVRALRRAPAS